jgi:hypothetical protein
MAPGANGCRLRSAIRVFGPLADAGEARPVSSDARLREGRADLRPIEAPG